MALKIHVVLKRLLLERKITVTQLAKLASVPHSTLSTWMIPGSKPKDPEQVARVAKALSVTMHQLYFDEPEIESALEGLPTELFIDGIYRLRLDRILVPKRKKGEGG
ncbi:helix-turn-helix transcriptional regulator [Bdellovibrionota bacterium FG-2]